MGWAAPPQGTESHSKIKARSQGLVAEFCTLSDIKWGRKSEYLRGEKINRYFLGTTSVFSSEL